jgi:hypothetical protein
LKEVDEVLVSGHDLLEEGFEDGTFCFGIEADGRDLGEEEEGIVAVELSGGEVEGAVLEVEEEGLTVEGTFKDGDAVLASDLGDDVGLMLGAFGLEGEAPDTVTEVWIFDLVGLAVEFADRGLGVGVDGFERVALPDPAVPHPPGLGFGAVAELVGEGREEPFGVADVGQ